MRPQETPRPLASGTSSNVTPKRPLIMTLYVPETNDRRVTEEDAAIFGSAATIYDLSENECLARVTKLLTGEGRR